VILAVQDLVPDPPLAFAAAGPGGSTLSVQLFSGRCRVAGSPDAKLMERLTPQGKRLPLGFYVPDAGPFRPSYQLQAWAELSLVMTEISNSDVSQRGPYGVDDVGVELVDDGRGSGSQWPYLSFTAHGGTPMLLRYRLTVTQPVD
jgi:hypothetical protein